MMLESNSNIRWIDYRLGDVNTKFNDSAPKQDLVDQNESMKNAWVQIEKQLKESPYPDNIARGIVECIENNSNTTLEVPEIDGKLDVCLVGRKNGIPGQITNYLFRKDILLKVNGYNEFLKFNEDFDLILRIAKIKMFRGLNKVGFIQHIRQDSWSKSDPHVTFDGVEDFLDNAFDKELLPISEIEQRRKDNRLSLVKKLLIQRKQFSEVIPYIDEAFNIINPQNLKEFLLITFNRMIKIIIGLK